MELLKFNLGDLLDLTYTSSGRHNASGMVNITTDSARLVTTELSAMAACLHPEEDIVFFL